MAADRAGIYRTPLKHALTQYRGSDFNSMGHGPGGSLIP